MMSLVTIFGPLAAKLGLSILQAFMDKNKADVEAQAAFLAYTQAMAKGGLISVNLHDSFAQQQKDNAAKAAAQYAAEHPDPAKPASPTKS